MVSTLVNYNGRFCSSLFFKEFIVVFSGFMYVDRVFVYSIKVRFSYEVNICVFICMFNDNSNK